jgi:uncharacterized membrane protein
MSAVADLLKEINWHPIFVHFPLALLPIAAASLVYARFWPQHKFSNQLAVVGTWTLGLAAVAALVSVASGFATTLHLTIDQGEAQRNFSLHERWAIFSSVIVLALAVLRTAGRASAARPSLFLVGALIFSCVALVVTGFYGGENVYHFGLGLLAH